MTGPLSSFAQPRNCGGFDGNELAQLASSGSVCPCHFDRNPNVGWDEVETRSEAQSPEGKSILNRSLRSASGSSRDDMPLCANTGPESARQSGCTANGEVYRICWRWLAGLWYHALPYSIRRKVADGADNQTHGIYIAPDLPWFALSGQGS